MHACSFSVRKATTNVDRSGVIGGSAYCVGSDLSLAIRFFESLSIDCPRNCTHHHSPHHPTTACPTRRQSAPTQTYRLSQAPQLAPTQKPPAHSSLSFATPARRLLKPLSRLLVLFYHDYRWLDQDDRFPFSAIARYSSARHGTARCAAKAGRPCARGARKQSAEENERPKKCYVLCGGLAKLDAYMVHGSLGQPEGCRAVRNLLRAPRAMWCAPSDVQHSADTADA